MYGTQVTAIASEQIEVLCGTFTLIDQFLLGSGVSQQRLNEARHAGSGGKAGYLMRVLEELDEQAPDLLGKILAETMTRLAQGGRDLNVVRLESAITRSIEGRGASAASVAEETATDDAEPAADGDSPSPAQREPVVAAAATDQTDWDVFVCHASEDKAAFVRPLAERLHAEGLSVWYDDFTISIGDSLRRKIDDGLAKSRYGVVVLSHAFFAKHWPQRELDGLDAREADGRKVILPVWLNVDREDVVGYSPVLADRLAAKASDGLDKVVAQLLEAMGMGNDSAAKPQASSAASSRRVSGGQVTPINLSQPAKELLIEAARDPNGTIIMVQSFAGWSVDTNGKSFVESGDARSAALWRGTVRELTALQLVESSGSELFTVTDQGYQVADALVGA